MKFFAKILSALASISILSGAYAQSVVYRMSTPVEKIDLASTTPLNSNSPTEVDLGRMVFNYHQKGYVATMSGETLSLEVADNIATVKMGKLTITIREVGVDYWHKMVNVWIDRPVTTSFGDKGVAKMLYAGMRPEGRLYHEELWLNGRRFNQSATVVDHKDQIVWSRATDHKGTLLLSRL